MYLLFNHGHLSIRKKMDAFLLCRHTRFAPQRDFFDSICNQSICIAFEACCFTVDFSWGLVHVSRIGMPIEIRPEITLLSTPRSDVTSAANLAHASSQPQHPIEVHHSLSSTSITSITSICSCFHSQNTSVWQENTIANCRTNQFNEWIAATALPFDNCRNVHFHSLPTDRPKIINK